MKTACVDTIIPRLDGQSYVVRLTFSLDCSTIPYTCGVTIPAFKGPELFNDGKRVKASTIFVVDSY